MGPRWFIAILLLAFSILVAALWTYLSATEDGPPPAWMRTHPDLPPATEVVGDAVQTIQPSPRRARPRLNFTPQMNLASLVDQLDGVLSLWRLDIDDRPMVQLLRARWSLATGRPDLAVRGFDAVLRKNPYHPRALAGKADAMIASRRLDEAAKLYRMAVTSAPRDAGARYNYGVLLCRLSKFGEAAEQFREVIALCPTHASAHYNLASLAQRDGRLVEARQSWLAFTQLRPEVASGWFHLGVLWMDLDEPSEAARCFAIFTALAPDDPDGRLNLGEALAAAGDPQSALMEVLTADRLLPCDDRILSSLANLHAVIDQSSFDETNDPPHAVNRPILTALPQTRRDD